MASQTPSLIPSSPLARLPLRTLEVLQRFGPIRPFYVESGDFLTLSSWNSAAGVRVRLRYRFINPAGEVILADRVHTPHTDRTSETDDFPLGQGFLLDAIVGHDAGVIRRGQCFIQLGLVRGGGAVRTLYALLLRGYLAGDFTTLEGNYALTWPGSPVILPTEGVGVLRSVTGTNPAAGFEISETVPTDARWRLMALRATLITSAAVANRQPELQINDGVNIIWRTTVTTAVFQGASTTNAHNWLIGWPATETAGSGANFQYPLPPDMDLMAAFNIGTNTLGLQAGDDYSAPQMTVLEWIET